MPIYDYECLETGEVFEHHQNFSELDLTECKCKGKKHKVKKRISLPQIVINNKNTMTDRKLYKELDID